MPPGRGSGTLNRVLVLTPYVMETILADARRTGHGTRIDVARARREAGVSVRLERDAL